MPLLIVISGFAGAWLLVAGPVYQAANELDTEHVDRQGLRNVARGVPRLERVSPWWWLLPPVAVGLHARLRRQRRPRMVEALSGDQLKQLLIVRTTVNGWLYVAVGGLLIAVEQTWNLAVLLRLSAPVFVLVVVVCLVLSLLHTVLRVRHNHRTLNANANARTGS